MDASSCNRYQIEKDTICFDKAVSSICRKGHEGWNKDMAEIFTAIK